MNTSVTEIPKTSQNPIVVEAQQHQPFINDFCEAIGLYMNHHFNYVQFNEDQVEARKKFLEEMKTGVASIKGDSDLCRGVCVSIQAAIEGLLAQRLRSGELTQVTAYFLTGLPCTPLRTSQQNVDTHQKAEWKSWTVNVRTNTLRELRDGGAKIVVSYCKTEYQDFQKSPNNKEACTTYESEKSNTSIQDCPLNVQIPKDLIGAVYLFTDKQGTTTYQIATQGIQIQHHGEVPEEDWKKWIGVQGTNSPVNQRCQEVLNFIEQNK